MIFAAFQIAASEAAQLQPCDQIKVACVYSGFVEKNAKPGKDLWKNCVSPIMQKKSGLVLPRVIPTVVAACKAKNPGFGAVVGK